MRRFVILLTLPTLLTGAQEAPAQEFQMARPNRVQIYGGQPARVGEWPASLYFKDESLRPCSSTVIGPRVILTAAHCVRSVTTGDVIIGSSKTKLSCTRHERYIGDEDPYDIALCFAESDIKLLPDDSPYETLNVDYVVPGLGSEVVLQGYGCTERGETDVLNIGRATVAAKYGSEIQTSGGAVVCYGDSGGGAFSLASVDRRRVIGVNARGDRRVISGAEPLPDRLSVVISVAHGEIKSFIERWSQSHDNARICGLNLSTKCR